jgi:RNA polymerase primary sigma factor
MQSVYDNGKSVRLPINKINSIGKINKAAEKLYHKFDREPTIQELVEATELTEKEVKLTVNNSMSYISLDHKVSEDSDSEVGDFIAGKTMDDIDIEINIDSLKQEINSIFEDLSEREISILNMHFGLNGRYEMSLKEIGKEMNLTNERVRQIKEFALKKLRMYGKSSKLKEFLECKL